MGHSPDHQSQSTDHLNPDNMPINITPPRGFLGRCFSWKAGTPPKWLVIMATIALNIAFGFYPVIIKIFAGGQSTHHINPFVFTLYRGLGAFPVLFLASYFVEGPIPIPDLRMSGVFFGLGLTGIAGGQFLYITGAYILPADIASAFQPLIPVWTTLIAIATCTEKMPSLCMLHSWAKIIGVFVATGGAVRLALAGYEPEAEQIGVHVSKQAVGYLCLVMETMLGAMYYIIQKKFVYQVEDCKWKEYPMAMTGYAYLFGCVYEGLFCLYFVVTGQFDAFHLPRQSVPALVYAVFMTSAFCYFLISWSNKYLPSSVMTAFWPVQVVTTAVTAYVLLGDTLTPTQLLSASVIIAGLAMVVYSNRVDEKISKTGEGGIRLDSCYGHHKSNGS